MRPAAYEGAADTPAGAQTRRERGGRARGSPEARLTRGEGASSPHSCAGLEIPVVLGGDELEVLSKTGASGPPPTHVTEADLKKRSVPYQMGNDLFCDLF